jgi:signal peptidase I
MTTARLTGILAGLVALSALAVAWTFFAPRQAGGGTSYAIIVGSSMEPGLHRGDLAIVRERSTYRVGDVVLYDSRDLGTKVLHRIVRVEGNRFVLQGDNNDFLDPEKPTQAQIVGALWTSAPAVGRVAEWVRDPFHGALLVALVTLIALGGGLGAGAAVRKGPRGLAPVPRRARLSALGLIREEQNPLLLGLVVGAVVVVALALVSFTRPVTAVETVDAAYVHQGRFEYESRVARNAAYPDGHVTTGEPVFLRLVDRIRVSFEYGLDSDVPVRASGRIALDARISDGRGWERVLPLAAARRFSNGVARVSGALDLRRIERIVEEVRSLTGSGQTVFTVAVRPRVDVNGRVGAESFETTFAPVLSFDYGDLRLQPSLDAGEGVGPFAPRETGRGSRPGAAELSLGALSLSVGAARKVSLLGIAALLLLGGLALVTRRPTGADEVERIRARYGHLLLPVAARSGQWQHVTDLTDMEALVRVAQHQGRLILHVTEGREHAYVVEDGGNAFRYRLGPLEPLAPVSWPPVRDPRARGDEAR